MRLRTILLGAVLITALGGCVGEAARNSSGPPPYPLPSGPVGKSIEEGREIVLDTPRLMKGYVRAGMSCSACHIAAGTQPRGGSFVGVYARFPQWNRRAHRVIALQDRIAECFLYSMNGKAPAYNSKPMIAIVAYIAWLSRGVPIGEKEPNSDRYVVGMPKTEPNRTHGQALYAAKCAICHGAHGNGFAGVYPPLWGPASFNRGAGMAHIDRMAGFVLYNMPQNAPGTLSLSDSYDVAAFVLSHRRPRFRGNDKVVTPAVAAKYF